MSSYDKLLNYYNLVKYLISLKIYNQQDVLDETQEYFLTQWKYRHTLGDHISINFIEKSVYYFLINRLNFFTAQKRGLKTVNNYELINNSLSEENLNDLILTKELSAYVDNMTNKRLRAAITNRILDEHNLSDLQYLRNHKETLCRKLN